MSGDGSESFDGDAASAPEADEDRSSRIARLAAVGAFAVPVVASFAMADSAEGAAISWKYGGASYVAYWSNYAATPPSSGGYGVLPGGGPGGTISQTTPLPLPAGTTLVRFQFTHTSDADWSLSVDGNTPGGSVTGSGAFDQLIPLAPLSGALPVVVTFTGTGNYCQIDNVKLWKMAP